MNNLGQKIKEQRIKKGLTQQEFAELLYVSDKTISVMNVTGLFLILICYLKYLIF